jgi:hypothetical protein
MRVMIHGNVEDRISVRSVSVAEQSYRTIPLVNSTQHILHENCCALWWSKFNTFGHSIDALILRSWRRRTKDD